jgi:SOS response regulatory protein OraA/RecX
VPRVTALRELPRARVAVELDGTPWRTIPASAAARAAIRVGLDLDRPRLRELRRELRRAEAVNAATRALRHRDHSRASLEARLAEADVAPAARDVALATLERLGVVDDGRAAAARAAALAARGYGDTAIRHDLEARRFGADAVDAALSAIDPEGVRVQVVVARRGASPATTRRLL